MHASRTEVNNAAVKAFSGLRKLWSNHRLAYSIMVRERARMYNLEKNAARVSRNIERLEKSLDRVEKSISALKPQITVRLPKWRKPKRR